MTIPLHVTAHIDTTTVGVDAGWTLLDGPLSWAWAMRAHERGEDVPPITRAHAPDLPIPLATWEECGTWGWCTSIGHPHVVAWTSIEVRRKPAVDAMGRWIPDARHHLSLGPHKARNTVAPAVLVDRVEWDIDATDRTDVEDLLGRVSHLGGMRGTGHGHVTRWTVEPGTRGAWRDRPMPTPGAPAQPYRAPYWHHTRRIEVTGDAHARP